MMLAEGIEAPSVQLAGRTINVPGAMPNVHCSVARLTTWMPMLVSPR